MGLNCGMLFFKRPVQKCLEGERHPHQKPPQSLLRCWRLHLSYRLASSTVLESTMTSIIWTTLGCLTSERSLATFNFWSPSVIRPLVLHRINFGRYLQTQITYIKHRKKHTKPRSRDRQWRSYLSLADSSALPKGCSSWRTMQWGPETKVKTLERGGEEWLLLLWW